MSMDSATGSSPVKPSAAPSLRWRIAVAVAALVLLAILGQAVALLAMFEEREESFIDEVLVQQIGHSMAMSRVAPEAAYPNTPDMRLYRIAPGAAATDVPAQYAALSIGNHEVFANGREYHVAVREDDTARYILVYDVHEHLNRVHSMKVITLTSTLPLVLVALAVGYALSGRLALQIEWLARRASGGEVGSYLQPGMERELQTIARALDALEARQASLLAREREFSADLAHELRTPLTGIRTDAELLAALPGLPDAVGRRAGRIIASVDRIGQLADSLLMLAREAQPRLVEAVALRPAIESCWAELGTGARLRLEMPPLCSVMADASLLALVVRNLLDNAARHAGEGDVVCSVAGSVLEIRDSGPGFPPAELERVFDRFHRGPGGRYGLGLALVRHVCLACGWRASAANAPGGGGVVRVDFGAALVPA